MLAEGIVGIIAGAQAHSIAVIAWAIGSVVEAAAAVIVIVRFTGANRFSDTAERRAQRWVAASFFVLVPYIVTRRSPSWCRAASPSAIGWRSPSWRRASCSCPGSAGPSIASASG